MGHLNDIAARILAKDLGDSFGKKAVGRSDGVISQVGNIVNGRFASQRSKSGNLIGLGEELLDNPNALENDKMLFISDAQIQLGLRRVYFSGEALIIVLRDIGIDIGQHGSIYDALYNRNSVDVAVKVLLVALRGESINQKLGELNTELADNYFSNLKENLKRTLSTGTNEEKINFIETFFGGNKNSFWYKVSEKLAGMYNPNDFFQRYRKLYEKLLNYKSNSDSQDTFIELIILYYENKGYVSIVKQELEKKESELKEQAVIDGNNQRSFLRERSLEVLQGNDNNEKIQVCNELMRILGVSRFNVNLDEFYRKGNNISNFTYSIISSIYFYYVQSISGISYNSDFPEKYMLDIRNGKLPFIGLYRHYFPYSNISDSFLSSDEGKILNICIEMLIIFLDNGLDNSDLIKKQLSDLNSKVKN